MNPLSTPIPTPYPYQYSLLPLITQCPPHTIQMQSYYAANGARLPVVGAAGKCAPITRHRPTPYPNPHQYMQNKRAQFPAGQYLSQQQQHHQQQVAPQAYGQPYKPGPAGYPPQQPNTPQNIMQNQAMVRICSLASSCIKQLPYILMEISGFI